jgi:hypothetical protein
MLCSLATAAEFQRHSAERRNEETQAREAN